MLVRAAVLILAAVLTYGNGITAPFLFDDQNSVVDNASIRQLSPLSVPLSPPRDTPVAGRPLVNLSLALNYAAGGLDPRGYHVVNLAIHLIAALLLAAVVRRTMRLPVLAPRLARDADDVGWAVAFLWTLHPLQSEVVDYVSARTESLMALCALLTLYAAIRAIETQQRRWEAAAIAACAAGMLCKESMVVVPVLVALYDRVFAAASVSEMVRRRWRLHAGLMATWAIVAAVLISSPREAVGFAAGTSWYLYFLNQLAIVPTYFLRVVWPVHLVLDYGVPQPITVGDVLAPGAFLVLLAIATIVALVRWPAAGYAGAWVFITLAPTSSIVPIVTEVGAERRMYLPMAAIVTLAAAGVVAWLRRVPAPAPEPTARPGRKGSARRAATPVAARWPTSAYATLAVVCVVLAWTARVRTAEYESRVRMAETVVARRPGGRAYFTLATELIRSGRTGEGRQYLERAVRDYVPAHYALGVELAAQMRWAEAASHLEAFIDAKPDDAAVPPARDLLGRSLLAQGDLEGAATQFTAIVSRTSNYPGAHAWLGAIRFEQQRFADAVPPLTLAAQQDPTAVDVATKLGVALAAVGRVGDAVAPLQRAVSLRPQDPGVRVLLARALTGAGRYDDAAAEFRRVAALAPGDVAAQRAMDDAVRIAEQHHAAPRRNETTTGASNRR